MCLPIDLELELSRLNDDTVELLFKRLFMLVSNGDGRLWFICVTFVVSVICCCVLDRSDARFVGDGIAVQTAFTLVSFPFI